MCAGGGGVLIWAVGDGFWEGAGCFGGGSGFASVGGLGCLLHCRWYPSGAAADWGGPVMVGWRCLVARASSVWTA